MAFSNKTLSDFFYLKEKFDNIILSHHHLFSGVKP